ncbi:MAG: protein phosphatase 2C domain-containing protein [Acidobacteriota bacterium]|nr:protein phosphatase 2C domain-containing protein [Acidobacteriota bacterium]
MLEIEFAGATDCGPVRPHNEDFIGHLEPGSEAQLRLRGWLFAVADGVGGSDRGEVASRMTVETLLAEYAEPGKSAEPPAARLEHAIQTANTAVYEEGHGAIASTVVSCALRYDRAIVAHVGDSRCYLLRNGRARVLTRDHTLANEQARLGFAMAPKNVLSRSIGTHLFVSVEVNEFEVRRGDMLLLCSDGLHGAITAESLTQTASQAAPGHLQDAVRELIAVANHSDGGDNVSVQLIRIKSVEAVGMYRGRPYRLHG